MAVFLGEMGARLERGGRLQLPVARLLGLELKLRQYEQGKIFCDAVVQQGGTEALHHVFSAPSALPTLIELRDPSAWLARTGPERDSQGA